jgi:hypothetical protein
MNTYNLTDSQKDLLREFVRQVREKTLTEPLSLHTSARGRPMFYPYSGEGEFEFEHIDDLDVLCDAGLVKKGRYDRYSLLQSAYDAVDSNFAPPPGDTFIMSGNFQGAILNIQSTLTQVSQTIATSPHVAPSAKEELQGLVDQLKEALQQTPPDRTEEAKAVAQFAELLVQTATAEKPNKPMLQISGEGLKKAAQNLAEAMPLVLTIATQIVAKINQLGGLPPG